MLGFLVATLVSLVVVGFFEGARIMWSACQWLSKGSALADPASVSTSSLPGEGDHDGPVAEQPLRYRTSHGRLLSSLLPACCTAALVAAAVLLGGLVAPSVSLAGPFTVECEQLLEEEDEIEGGKENLEWTLYLEQCEEEAKAFSEHPTNFDSAPDMDAFRAGTEIVIFAVVFTIASFVVLNWIIKTMRSSQ